MRLKPGVPVLALPDGGVRVGVHTSVDFARLSARQRDWLARIETGISDADAREFPLLARRLTRAGLVDDDRPSLPARLTARLHAPRAIRESLVPLAAACGLETTASAYGPVDVDVLVSMGGPSLAAVDLLARDEPHLIVTTDEAGVTVGPFIKPGHTCCHTCLGLHRAERDPAWPYVAVQCDARPPRIAAPLLPDVAMLIARACRGGLAGDDPGVWRVDPTCLTHSRTPAPHPDCHCLAGGGMLSNVGR